MPDDLIARLLGPLPIREPRNLTEQLLRPLSQGPLPVDMAAIRAERIEAAAALAAKDAEIARLSFELASSERVSIARKGQADHLLGDLHKVLNETDALHARLAAADRVANESRMFAIRRREGLRAALAAYDALVKEPPSDAR